MIIYNVCELRQNTLFIFMPPPFSMGGWGGEHIVSLWGNRVKIE